MSLAPCQGPPVFWIVGYGLLAGAGFVVVAGAPGFAGAVLAGGGGGGFSLLLVFAGRECEQADKREQIANTHERSSCLAPMGGKERHSAAFRSFAERRLVSLHSRPSARVSRPMTVPRRRRVSRRTCRSSRRGARAPSRATSRAGRANRSTSAAGYSDPTVVGSVSARRSFLGLRPGFAVD